MAVVNIPVIKFYIKEVGDFLLEFRITRILFFLCCFFLYFFHIFLGRSRYNAVGVVLKCQKILSEFHSGVIGHMINFFCDKITIENSTDIIISYLESSKCIKYKNEFYKFGKSYTARIKYPKNNDIEERQGDLIILKPYIDACEKGVILIKYNKSFERFLAFFDLEKISANYRIVLEPSTWGYQDVIYLLFRELAIDVIVQSQCYEDFEYIKRINGNLWPVPIGAGDWGDADLFNCGEIDKQYDLIMVASWQLLKRHRLLFNALSLIKPHLTKVCLVGYPAGGRTKSDIILDAKSSGVLDLLDIFENIAPAQVARKISKSKVSVMLSKREGASKVVYESLFCNVPVLVADRNRGINRNIINPQTGMLTSDKDLAENILRFIRGEQYFSPRKWAVENTGYLRSHKVLNEFIRNIAILKGEIWRQDIYMKKNAPNLIYINKDERVRAEKVYLNLEGFLA